MKHRQKLLIRKTVRGARRRGYMMMMVVVTMTVIILTLVAMVRQAAIVANSVRIHKEQSQVAWILESGIERARARLMADPQFSSETWHVDVASNGAEPAAVVEIQVHGDAETNNEVSVKVTIAKRSRPALTARKKVSISSLSTAK